MSTMDVEHRLLARREPPSRDAEIRWHDVCALAEIAPDTGVAALVEGQQIAIFRYGPEDAVYALDNFDPFSRAFVLARGIVGDRGGQAKVSAPIYKQSFCLRSGNCLDDPTVSVPTYPVRQQNGRIEVAVRAPRPE